MTITISPTASIVFLEGVPGRIWEGKSGTGKEVVAFICGIATTAENAGEQDEFKKELYEILPPPIVNVPSDYWTVEFPTLRPSAGNQFEDSIEKLGRLYESGKDFMADNLTFAGVAGYNTMVGILQEMRDIAATALRETRYNDTGASTKDTTEARQNG